LFLLRWDIDQTLQAKAWTLYCLNSELKPQADSGLKPQAEAWTLNSKKSSLSLGSVLFELLS